MNGALPRGWATAPLGELGDWIGGGTPSKAVSEYWREGTVHWVSPKDMKRPLIDSAQDQITEMAVRESATNLVPANSVLMVTRSGILEHSFPVAVNTVPVTMNQDLKAVAIRGADPIYTRYFLQARAQDILRTCKKDGTTVSSIDTDRLAAYEVALAPAAEQKRIVSKIDELFSRIDEGERALERVSVLVERYRQSVLKAAVTGDLTRAWREKNQDKLESGEAVLARILTARREAWEKAELEKMKSLGITPAGDRWKHDYQEPSQPNADDLPKLPASWTWASLEQLAYAGPTNGYSPKSDPHATGTQSLKLTATTSGTFRLDQEATKRLNEVIATDSPYWLSPGDMLIQRANSLDHVGVAAIFDGPPDTYVYPDLMMRVRVDHDEVRRWVWRYINGVTVRRYFQENATGTAGSMPKINGRVVREVMIPLPGKLELCIALSRLEQGLGAADLQLREVGAQLLRIAASKRSILCSAFTGTLVQQNPTDEPASALLERIAAERSADTSAPKRGRKKKTSE